MASDELLRTRAFVERHFQPFVDVATSRENLERIGVDLPSDITSAAVVAGGVPAQWVATKDADDSVVMYLHGGGYISGSLRSTGNFAAYLARLTNSRVLHLDYRLAPEHPHPAAVNDALAAYSWLIANENVPASSIAVCGESAGGGLTVGLLLALRAAGLPQPSAAAVGSPQLDLTFSGESFEFNKDKDIITTAEDFAVVRDIFLGPNNWIDDPLASPLAAEDLSDLAPILVQVADEEILLSDSVRFAKRIEAAGGQGRLDVWPEVFHAWHAFAGMFPEAEEGIAHMAAWFREHLADPWLAARGTHQPAD